MSKKKTNKSYIINNIDSIHMDIDYKKLANALIEAKKEAEKKEMKNKKFRISGMRCANILIYMSLFLISVIVIACIWGVYFKSYNISLIEGIVFSVIFAFLAIYSVMCHVESFKDSAKEIMAHFNTNMSVVALLIAFIALLRGVK